MSSQEEFRESGPQEMRGLRTNRKTAVVLWARHPEDGSDIPPLTLSDLGDFVAACGGAGMSRETPVYFKQKTILSPAGSASRRIKLFCRKPEPIPLHPSRKRDLGCPDPAEPEPEPESPPTEGAH